MSEPPVLDVMVHSNSSILSSFIPVLFRVSFDTIHNFYVGQNLRLKSIRVPSVQIALIDFHPQDLACRRRTLTRTRAGVPVKKGS